MAAHRAIIHWIERELGGRQAPPAGDRYSAPVKFVDEPDTWPDEAWSLLVERISADERGWTWNANVCYLMAEAPAHLLKSGAAFELYEGRRCVAQGQVY